MYAAFSACARPASTTAGAPWPVQGFGKVGGLAAQFLHDAGCLVVAVSTGRAASTTRRDSTRPPCSSTCGPARTPSSASRRGRDHQRRADRAGRRHPGARCARGRDPRGQRRPVKAFLVVEGRQRARPRPDADKILEGNNVLVVPDVLANSGGVAVSYFEWVQDLQAYFWSEDEVNDRLKALMESAYDQVSTMARERGRLAAHGGADDRRRPGRARPPHPRAVPVAAASRCGAASPAAARPCA
jgi:glutamate dehydrogenase (NAD(P)+)